LTTIEKLDEVPKQTLKLKEYFSVQAEKEKVIKERLSPAFLLTKVEVEKALQPFWNKLGIPRRFMRRGFFSLEKESVCTQFTC
jgi:hypothetical protein